MQPLIARLSLIRAIILTFAIGAIPASITLFMYLSQQSIWSWDFLVPGLMLVITFSLTVLLAMNCFDRSPRLIIDGKGVWTRKSWGPFSNTMKVTPYESITGFGIAELRRKGKGPSYMLEINAKEQSKSLKVDLDSLDTSRVHITDALSAFTVQHNILNWGVISRR